MVEGAIVTQRAQAETTPKVNLAELQVRSETSFKEDRGLQAVLLCAEETSFSPNQEKIQQKLDGSLDDRWNFKLFDKASKQFRKEHSKDVKMKPGQWEAEMVQWVNGPKGSETLKQVFAGILNQPPENFQLNEQNIKQVVDIVYKKGGGIEAFVKAALKAEGLKDPNNIQEIKLLAGTFFGYDVSSSIITQVISLEATLKDKPDKNKLAAELNEAGKDLSANGVYLVNEIKKLIVRQNVVNLDKKEDIHYDSNIAAKKDLGGRPKQQDNTLIVKEGLPSGIKAIAVVADGHGVDGYNASKFGAQLFEAKLVDIIRSNPSLDIKKAIAQAVKYADKQLIEKFPDGGTTLSAVIQIEGKAYVVNVGDSKAHLISEGKARKITKDHNRADIGKANVITRSLGDGTSKEGGSPVTAQPDIFEVELKTGDRIILSSDGLIFTGNEIQQIIADKKPDEAVNALIEAKKKKKPDGDNTTAMVMVIK